MNFMEKLFHNGRHNSIRAVCYEYEHAYIDSLIPAHIHTIGQNPELDEQNKLFEEGWKTLMINWCWFDKWVLEITNEKKRGKNITYRY